MPWGKPKLLENGESVAQCEAHALQYSARHVIAGVCQTEPRKRGPQGRVPMRRPLSLEVGKERHTVSPGGYGCRFLDELRVSIPIRQIARALITIPGERAAGRQDDAHHVPDIGDDVTERVRPQ